MLTEKIYQFLIKKLEINLCLGFLILILIGVLFLMLPFSTTGSISFIDALFTTTSAVCVTGLVVKDTGADFTIFGQTVILILIQLGGLGIMIWLGGLYFTFNKKEIWFIFSNGNKTRIGR